MEIWVPYGDVESLVTLMQENLGETIDPRSEEHTSELQSQSNLVCRLLLEKKKNTTQCPSTPLPSDYRRYAAIRAARRFQVAPLRPAPGPRCDTRASRTH